MAQSLPVKWPAHKSLRRPAAKSLPGGSLLRSSGPQAARALSSAPYFWTSQAANRRSDVSRNSGPNPCGLNDHQSRLSSLTTSR